MKLLLTIAAASRWSLNFASSSEGRSLSLVNVESHVGVTPIEDLTKAFWLLINHSAKLRAAT